MVPAKPDVREPMRINRTITVRGESTRLQMRGGSVSRIEQGRNYKDLCFIPAVMTFGASHPFWL